MANYHAVYIDSPASWTYNTDSYDSKLGFYSNAWLTNETEETSETPVISCSYFYELGKQDEVGFTPRRISMNESSGILTVEGKQENVSSLVSKSFRLNSPSPRFLNLRESMRKRRPARFIVNNIITDDDAELNNIKDYLGLNEEEAEVISRAEEFGADTPDPINPEYIEEAVQYLPKEQYLEFCDYFEIDPNDEKELSQFLQKNRNDSNVLMKLDILNLDAWYDSRYGSYGSLFRAEEFDDMGYPLNMTRFSYQKEKTEAYPNGQEILSYSIYFGDDRMFNLNSALFGYDDESVQRIVDELNESIRSSMQQVFQRLNWKSQRHDSLDVMLRSEEFSLEDGQRIPHLTLKEWTAVSKALGEVGTFHNWNHELTDGEGGNGTTLVVDKKNGVFGRRNEYLCNGCGKMQSAGLFGEFRKHEPLTWCDYCEDEEEERLERLMGAEEFGAEDEDEKAERIMKLLRVVKRKATGSNARYAKTYAREAENAYYQYGMRGLTTQVAYVLSNLSGWRGEEAKSVKAELRKLIK